MSAETLPAEASHLAGTAGYQVGYECGLAVTPYAEGLQAAIAAEHARLKREQNMLAEEVLRLQEQHDLVKTVTDTEAADLARIRGRFDQLDNERFGHPSDYSLVKSLLYLLLAGLLILADTSLLADAIAKLLILNWETQGGDPFTQVLLQNPKVALQTFGDLILITTTVLLIGMTVKLLRDAYIRYLADRSARNRAELVCIGIVNVLAAACILLTAVVRYKTPFPGGVPAVAQWFSAVLGFSLPYISAAFFIAGYDVASNWRARSSAEKLLKRCTKDFESYRNREKMALADVMRVGAQLEESRALSDQFLSAQVATAYANGYRRGLADLFNRTGSGGFYTRVKPAAVRSLAASE